MVGYGWHSLAADFVALAVLLGSGLVLYAISIPWASGFHRALAAIALAALGASMISGRFESAVFFEGLVSYFGIVVVLLVLSIAGYPVRAARYEAQIRSLVGAMTRRGVGVRPASGALGHLLGAVLDVGSLVLVDILCRRAAPKERIPSLLWAGRSFSFAPFWTNLNLLTITTITLTGVSYLTLLSVSLPFAILGLAAGLLFAQRESSAGSESSEEPVNRGALAVLVYPLLLVLAVALASYLIPSLPLTTIISLTVASVVAAIAMLASGLTRRASPLRRLGAEARETLTASHAEFALFGGAGILVLSLMQLGALDPLGRGLESLPAPLVAPALFVTIALGFLGGIHVVPMVLLVHAAFPLDSAPSPALWAISILLGSQSVLLISPFSNTTTMLARLTGMHPFEIGLRSNWRFSLAITAAAILYMGLLTPLLL